MAESTSLTHPEEWYDVYQMDSGYAIKVASFKYQGDGKMFIEDMTGSGYLSHKGRILDRKNVII